MKYDYTTYQGFKDASPEEIRDKLRASNGVQITEALFEETIQGSSRQSFEPIYTLRDYEYKGKPSAYYIYINSIDEADAALKLVGSLAHWRKLCSLKWFIKGRKEVGFEGLSQWREDMKNRDRTFAKNVLLTEAKLGNVTAARALEKWARDDKSALDKSSESVVGKNKGKMEDDTFLSIIDEIRS